MKSSDGRHWIALDHLRAIAALMVFNWHFLHGLSGQPIPFGSPPTISPLVLLDEGHAGVALFMTLSGYLFAKLLAGKQIVYWRFFWNRFIRLAPLLIFTIIAFAAVEAHQFSWFDPKNYAHDLLDGFLLPTWPNGGWSITVEMHFYILLPLILTIARRWIFAPAILLLAAIALRAALFLHYGEIQFLAYYTLAGRVDQFLLGIMAFHGRDFMRRKHWPTIVISLSFVAFYWWFDASGGFYGFGGRYPSPAALWIWLPTIEGAAFAWVIGYYDASFSPSESGVSKLIGRIGTYSYSIYLLHPFFVFRGALFIHHHILSLSNFYVACAVSLICFCGMIAIGWVSYTLIERPFLKLRVRYTKPLSKTLTELATA